MRLLFAVKDLVGNSARVGAHFKQRLIARLGEHPNVAEIRGEGLMVAIEFVADREKKARFDPSLKPHRQVVAAAKENGLIIRPLPQGDVCSFAPPLVFSEADAEKVVEVLGAAVEQVFARLRQ